METSMHGSFDRSGDNDNGSHRNWSVGFFAVPVGIAIALMAFVLTHPEASRWISQAAQAEFSGIDPAPETAPIQVARPTMELPTVKVVY
jgi:hypothetical protein